MTCEFIHRRQVEFHETDVAGIVHFSNFFRYMEAAEHAFFRSLGFSIHQEFDGRSIGFPRIKAECEYSNALKFEDVVETHLRVTEVTQRTIGYSFVLREVNSESPIEVARGMVKTICVTFDEREGRMKSIRIPAAILKELEVAPKETEEKGKV